MTAAKESKELVKEKLDEVAGGDHLPDGDREGLGRIYCNGFSEPRHQFEFVKAPEGYTGAYGYSICTLCGYRKVVYFPPSSLNPADDQFR